MKCACMLGVVISLTMGHIAQGQTRDTRPATPTATGDTGLWFVPSAEVLPSGRWSIGAARTESDFSQGFTDVEQWPISVGAGLGNWAEVFGSLSVVTRIDRDTTPLFTGNPEFGGLVNDFPSNREPWTGNKIGDLVIGGKASLLSEKRQQPLGLAVRAFTKIPTASDEEGIGTGKMDWFLDGVASREIARSVDLTGFTGFAWRGDPDNVDLSNGIRWGIGASVPSRSRLRLNTEFYGELFLDDDVVAAPGAVTGVDGTSSPPLSVLDNPKSFSFSVTWQGTGGAFIDAGMVYAFGVDRNDFTGDSVEGSDALGFQMRIGWHRGVGVYVPPPPAVALAAPAAPPAPAPEPPALPANQPPTVSAQCDPCEVEAGRPVTIRATGRDLDGDPLRYSWSSPNGAVADPSAASSQYTAPDAPGVQTVTVTVNDGRGGTASESVRVTVRERPVATSGLDVTFDDVHFDFDEATLKPEGTAVLERVAQAMTAAPEMRIQVDGHTDSIGTAQYNEQLSQRRAERVREYLVAKGISADRISLTGYGEARPERSNDTATDRAVNRRAVVTVRATAR